MEINLAVGGSGLEVRSFRPQPDPWLLRKLLCCEAGDGGAESTTRKLLNGAYCGGGNARTQGHTEGGKH